MDQLTPIPTPAAQRWREFRIQALPVLTFLAVIAVVAVLWHHYVFPSNIVGQVETTTVNIISTEPGLVDEVLVSRFQKVKKGDPIATITITDTNVLATSLQMVQADLQVMRARLEEGALRGGQVYERERLSFLEQQVALNVDRVNLKLAEAEFRSAEDLYTNNPPLINSNKFNEALFALEAVQVRVKETEIFLKEKARILPKLLADSTNSMATIEAAIRAQQAQVMAEGSSVTLRSPIDGVVSSVGARPGERIMSGLPVAVITATQAERIIAYVRQPITTIPKAGETLQIRRRTFKRQTATATIRDVGTQIEPFTPALLAMTGAAKIDLGLPFAINLPPSLGLVPGEVVDIIYDPKR